MTVINRSNVSLRIMVFRPTFKTGSLPHSTNFRKKMEPPIEDMKRFLDGIFHLYDEGFTKTKMDRLFDIKNEARSRLAEENISAATEIGG